MLVVDSDRYLDVLMMIPRSPSFPRELAIISLATSRITLKSPTTLLSITSLKVEREWGYSALLIIYA